MFDNKNVGCLHSLGGSQPVFSTKFTRVIIAHPSNGPDHVLVVWNSYK